MAKVAPGQAGLSKLVLLLIVLVAAFLGSGLTLGLYLSGVFGEPAGRDAASVEQSEQEVVIGAPVYIPLEQPLVVNFDRNGRMGYLQANIELMTRAVGVEAEIAQHLPVIRNDLILLLGSKTYSDVASREGKEALRQEALDTVNAILEQVGAKGRIEQLYFTGFVMQ